MKTIRYLILLSVIIIALASCNTRQNRNLANQKDLDKNALIVKNAIVEGEAGEPESVEDFLREAANSSLMDVELGRYAEKNAVNQRVKKFGSLMVREHTRVNEELSSLAKSKNIDIPPGMDTNYRNKVDDLKKEQGDDFDKEYMREMVDAHEKDTDRFRKMAEDGEDPEVKAFAAKTLPSLLSHQDSARNISDALR